MQPTPVEVIGVVSILMTGVIAIITVLKWLFKAIWNQMKRDLLDV